MNVPKKVVFVCYSIWMKKYWANKDATTSVSPSLPPAVSTTSDPQYNVKFGIYFDTLYIVKYNNDNNYNI